MNLEKKLIKLLDRFIKKNKVEKSTYEVIMKKKQVYEDLINLLEGNYDKIIENQDLILTFLDKIYPNSTFYEEFKKMISQFKNIKSYVSNIVLEYNNLLDEIEYYKIHLSESDILIESAHKIKNSLKYNKLIQEPQTDIKNIAKILNTLMSENELTNKDILLYLNMLEYHNDRKLSKADLPEEQQITEFKYNEIPNILNAGYQQHDTIEVSINKKNQLDSYALEVIEQISEYNEEEINNELSKYRNNKLQDNEYNYILLKILDFYLDELIEIYKLLLDKDIYTNKETRDEVIDDYYNKLNKYIIINRYYNSSMEYTPIEVEDEEDIEYKTEKKLIYSRSETNITKSRLISDMRDIPYEYYDTVYDLITRFKNGTLTANELKMLHNHKNFSGHLELRYDQVRIILKHIKGNLYSVIGAFAKKTDKDIHMYGRIINRGIPEVNTDEQITMQLELSQSTEEELQQLVKEKGRKGIR